MSIQAVFSADTHISGHTWASRSQIVGDSFFGFQQLCELAIANRCPLFLAGDCWELWRDPNPTAATVEFVRRQLDALQASGCPLYYINGQHDNLQSPFWFEAIHPWPQHIGGRTVEVAGRKFFGVDYFEAGLIDQVYASVPSDTFCLVIHQAWQEFTGSKIMAKLSLSQLPPVPLTISGDMHKMMAHQIDNRLFVSPGATHMRSMREPREHYAVVLDSEKGLDQFKLKSRQVLEYTIADPLKWLDQLVQLASSVDQSFGVMSHMMPLDVAKPILMVIDPFNCGAAAVIEKEIPDAHVMSKVSSDKELLTEAAEVRTASTSLVELLPTVLAGRSLTPEQLELIRVVVGGGNILQHLGVAGA